MSLLEFQLADKNKQCEKNMWKERELTCSPSTIYKRLDSYQERLQKTNSALFQLWHLNKAYL